MYEHGCMCPLCADPDSYGPAWIDTELEEMARSEQRAAYDVPADVTPISDIGPLIEPLVTPAERLGHKLRSMPADVADGVADRAVDVVREAIARGRTPPARADDFTLKDFLAPLPKDESS